MSGLDVLLQTAVSIKKLNILKKRQYEYLIEKSEPKKLHPGTLKKNLLTKDYRNPIHAIFEQTSRILRNQPSTQEIDKKFTNQVKNVSFVSPTFGSENAIVCIPPTPQLSGILKKPKLTDKSVLTETIEKIKQKEADPVEKTDIVTQTTQVIKVTDEQLDDVQKLIKEIKALKEKQKALQQKQNERLDKLTQKRRKKKKEREQIVSSISQLSKTLQQMHKEYLKRPKIQYKSVSDCFTQNNALNKECCTQSSCFDLLYENTKFPIVRKVVEYVPKIVKKDVINEDDKLVPDFKITAEPNYEYDDQISLNETDSDFKLLQAAEKSIENKLASMKSRKMQKFITAHQQIRHVDEVCDKLDDILYDSDYGGISDEEKVTDSATQTNDNNAAQQHFNDQRKIRKNKSAFTKPNLACGDDSKVEKCLKNSRYLLKEMSGFDSRSKMRILSDNGIISREILRVSDEAFDTQKQSITTLMENLSVVMKSSFYSPDI